MKDSNSAADLQIAAAPSTIVPRRTVRISFVLLGVALAILVLYNSAINPFRFLPVSYTTYRPSASPSLTTDPLLVSSLSLSRHFF